MPPARWDWPCPAWVLDTGGRWAGVPWLRAWGVSTSTGPGRGGGDVGGLCVGGRIGFQSLETFCWVEPAPAPGSVHPLGW